MVENLSLSLPSHNRLRIYSRLALTCSLGSPLAAALLLAACLAYYSVRTGIEEKLLQAEFGQQYEEYHRRVGRFLPRLPLAG